MKILIGVPCFEMCHSRFAQSMAAMTRAGEMEFFFCIGNGVAESRDIISHYAIDNGFDYVFFVDSDETFPRDVLPWLLAKEKDIVSGLVMHRKPPYEPVLYNEENGEWKVVKEIPNKMFKIDCSGGGACLLIKTSVLQKVWEEYGVIWSPDYHTTEDLSFALRVKKLDIDWWCDPVVEIGHLGSVEVRPESIKGY